MISNPNPSAMVTPSPLMVCDHLIGLAQEAVRAGCPSIAGRLVGLLDDLFEERRQAPGHGAIPTALNADPSGV